MESSSSTRRMVEESGMSCSANVPAGRVLPGSSAPTIARMASVPPRTERRRARPGSLQRPVNGRLYRGTWLLVGLPLLVAAFSVARRRRCRARSCRPSTARRQDSSRTISSTTNPNRLPGSPVGPRAWFREQLAAVRAADPRRERFSAVIPGRGRVQLQNIIAEAVGRSPRTIVVMAHRDNTGAARARTTTPRARRR